ncbi:unknown protein [Seminavis robusta]|uniref:Uncharacterized protein n=1 Tax=Seminavis robusta TaxID=568900 RepID=A0A9N8DCX4_9STRA|nr:unknown protein [Seminavis robusta]|eukprot:Sro39_g023940.1 n/a (432) ;mRNA; r:7928-9223
MASLPALVKQEVINCLATHAREIVMKSKAEGAKTEDQEKLMGKCYHGTDNHTPLLATFMAGRAPYDVCYNELPIQNNREGNENRTKLRQSFMLELKDILHCQVGSSFITHERGFTIEALQVSNGTKEIKGRNLSERALAVCANYKHAYRFYLEYTNSTNENPSGKKIEDMVVFVRQKMYVFLRGCKNTQGMRTKLKNETTKGKVSIFTEEEMPENYIFAGYMAFVLFGPMPLTHKTFSCLSPDGDGVPPQSRKEARKETVEAKKIDRDTGTGGFVPQEYVRGVPLQAKANAAFMEQRKWHEDRAHVRESWFIASSDYSSMMKELADIRVQIFEASDPDEIAELKKWRSDVLESMAKLRAHKKELQKRSSEMLLEEKNPKKAATAVTAFMQQVGAFGLISGSSETSPKSVPVVVNPTALSRSGTPSSIGLSQ